MIITVTLNPAIDVCMEVENWVIGGVNRAAAVRNAPGGKGINVSRVVRELGGETAALTALGAESVQQFGRLAREVKCPIVYITIPGQTRSNIHIMDRATGQNLKVNQTGTPLPKSHWEHFILLFRQQVKKARYVCLSGSLPPGLDQEAYAVLVREAHRQGVPVLIDAEKEALLAALAERPEVVKPNRAELAATVDGAADTTPGTIEAARRLMAMGAGSVIVTAGPKETIGVTAEEVWVAAPPSIDVHGTTGAGDSLAAGFAHGVVGGATFAEALRVGVACGTACCATSELNLATSADIQRLLPAVRVANFSSKTTFR